MTLRSRINQFIKKAKATRQVREIKTAQATSFALDYTNWNGVRRPLDVEPSTYEGDATSGSVVCTGPKPGAMRITVVAARVNNLKDFFQQVVAQAPPSKTPSPGPPPPGQDPQVIAEIQRLNSQPPLPGRTRVVYVNWQGNTKTADFKTSTIGQGGGRLWGIVFPSGEYITVGNIQSITGQPGVSSEPGVETSDEGKTPPGPTASYCPSGPNNEHEWVIIGFGNDPATACKHCDSDGHLQDGTFTFDNPRVAMSKVRRAQLTIQKLLRYIK